MARHEASALARRQGGSVTNKKAKGRYDNTAPGHVSVGRGAQSRDCVMTQAGARGWQQTGRVHEGWLTWVLDESGVGFAPNTGVRRI